MDLGGCLAAQLQTSGLVVLSAHGESRGNGQISADNTAKAVWDCLSSVTRHSPPHARKPLATGWLVALGSPAGSLAGDATGSWPSPSKSQTWRCSCPQIARLCFPQSDLFWASDVGLTRAWMAALAPLPTAHCPLPRCKASRNAG